MRFSDIVKSTDAVVETSSSRQAPPRPSPPAVSAAPVSAPRVTQEDLSAVADRIRKELQVQFEKEVQVRLEAAKEEARRAQEELIKAEEAKSFARAESLKKEKNQLLEQLDALKLENKEFKAAQQSLEELKKQMVFSQEKLAESFQQKIADLDAQLRNRPSDSLEAERRKIEKQVREELDAATRDRINDLERKVKEAQYSAEKKKTIAPSEDTPKTEGSFAPEPAAVKPINVPIPLNHPDAAREAIAFYEKFVHAGRGIFDQYLKNQELDLNQLVKVVSELSQLSSSLQDELIGIIVDPYPEEEYSVYHAVNVAILCVLLGISMKLEEKHLEELGMAGFLHDISLLTVKEGLSYPKQLSPDLQAELKKHPERSAEIIAPYVSDLVKTAVLQHHELSNGKGYPNALLNDAIHIYAKIINIADAFEAMVHIRPYRSKPYEVSEAVKEMIEKERGLYDRDVVKALLSRVGLYPIKSYVELSNKQIARILRQNRLFPISPVIQVEFDEDGNKIQPPVIIDLSKNQLLHITGPLKTGHSYSKEKITQEREKKVAQNAVFLLIKELIPLLVIALILGLFVYLVVKI